MLFMINQSPQAGHRRCDPTVVRDHWGVDGRAQNAANTVASSEAGFERAVPAEDVTTAGNN